MVMIQGDFNNSGDAGPSITASQALDHIVRERPDLAARPCVIPSRGTSAHTFLFEDEVIKTPRRADEFEKLSCEQRVLDQAHRAGLPVPRVTSVGEHYSYFGQQRMDGQHFVNEYIDTSSPRAAEYAEKIADFLHRLGAAFGPREVEMLGKRCTIPKPQDLRDALQNPHVKQQLGCSYDDVRNALEDYADRLPAKQPRLLHTDLSPANIVFDAASGDIRGFIDFGLCDYAAPEMAFVSLYREYPHRFVDMIADAYAAKENAPPIRYKEAVLCRLAYDVLYLPRDMEMQGPDSAAQRSWRRKSMMQQVDNLEDATFTPSVYSHHFMAIP